MVKESVTFQVTLTREAYAVLSACAQTVGLCNAMVARIAIYQFLMGHCEDFLPELKTAEYNKNKVVKKTIYMPTDYWNFLRNTGYPSLYIFNAIKEKRARELSEFNQSN